MKPYTRSIFDLFDGKRRYEVPLFQRQYVWTLDDDWEPLWEDIERKFEPHAGAGFEPPRPTGWECSRCQSAQGRARPAV
jgi:Protein of unknown function DUF262